MYRRGHLKNGMAYVFVPKSDTDVVITIGVGRGSADESRSWRGVTHYIEHLAGECFRARKQIACQLDLLGADFNAETSEDMTKWWIRIPARHWRWGLELMAELLLNPDFTQADFEFEGHCIREELADIADDPENQVALLRDRQLFPGHGLSRHVVGTPSSLQRLTLERVLRYWERLLDPRIMAITVVGRFEATPVITTINQLFGSLSPPQQPIALRSFDIPQPTSRISIMRAERQQVSLVATIPVPGFGHRQRAALQLLNNCIGDMNSSPLWLQARQRGLVYSLHSDIWHYPEVGLLTIATSCGRPKVLPLLTLIRRTLDRYYLGGITTDLFDAAKHAALSYHQRRWKESEYIGRLLLAQLLVHSNLELYPALRRRIARVRLQDVNAVAKRYLAPANRYLTVIGPVTRADRYKIKRLWRGGRST